MIVVYLKQIAVKPTFADRKTFPFNLEILNALSITFSQPVTLLVGDNGSGKSTLIEAIAAGAGSITVGGVDVRRDPTLEHALRLSDQIRFSWNRKVKKRFVLRAE